MKPAEEGGHITDDVIYVMAMKTASTASCYDESLLDTMVRKFQPSPVFVHVELLLPPHPHNKQMHFSTYVGESAGWGHSHENISEYYKKNIENWVAIPVVGTGIVKSVREACCKEIKTPYSVLGYLMSVPPMRSFAKYYNNEATSAAHCASLTARILTTALKTTEDPLKHAPSWYGPSTLVHELCKRNRNSTYYKHYEDTSCTVPVVGDATNVRLLISAPDDIVRRTLTAEHCSTAVLSKTMEVLKEMSSATGGVTQITPSQRCLAYMLLRWSLCINIDQFLLTPSQYLC